jgi:pimeloyl-ACP methyl ester carboxylesterase
VGIQHWPPTSGAARGTVLLIHGLSSIADSWWQIGPALAQRGWDVAAVDQAGHGGRPVGGEVTLEGLADAIRDVHPAGPDVLIGHSLGTLTALALVDQLSGWARTVILEEPASLLPPELCFAIAQGISADFAAVRDHRDAVVERVRQGSPRWADEDVHWAVEGIAQMDPAPFIRRLIALAQDERLRFHTPDQLVAIAPSAYVLAAVGDRVFIDGGSALRRSDREELTRRLPPGHVIGIDGGHCLHRDAPAEWLTAVNSIIDSHGIAS